MAKLLETWLNSEVELSRKVTNFEEDFSNGYLFGELLYKFNQQPDFDMFVDRDNRNNRLNNFTRLVPPLKALGVKPDHTLIQRILDKEQGAAIQLLYQIKMTLERTSPPIDVKLKQAGKAIEQAPIQKIRPVRSQFDTMELNQFKNRLNTINQSQKQIDLTSKLSKFEDFRTTTEMKVKAQKAEEELQLSKLKEEKRNAQINKLQRNVGFMEDWEQKGIQEWKKNMEIKKQREKLELEFKLKQSEKTQTKQVQAYTKAHLETILGIQEFEERQKKLENSVPTFMSDNFRTTTQNVGAVDSSIKTANLVLQERDIRRRTMATKLTLIEKNQEKQYRSEKAINKLDIVSNIEDSVAKDIWNVTRFTELFIAHRKLRETRYERRREYDSEIAQLKEKKMLERWAENTAIEIELEQERGRQLTISLNMTKRDERNSQAEKIFDLLFDIAEEFHAFQQHRDSLAVDDRYWREWITLFKEGVSVSEPSEKVLDKVAVEDYLMWRGQWPSVPVNHYLGDALQKMIDDLELGNTEFRREILSHPVKLALLGYSFSGKTTQANRLKASYDLDVIDIKECISNIADSTLRLGGTINDEAIVNYVVNTIKNCKASGFILVDFPANVNQAKLFEEKLSYFKPKYEREQDLKDLKKKLTNLVNPSQLYIIKEEGLENSVMDHVIWLEVSKQECLRRCYGRRRDTSNLLYHIDDDIPPITQSPLIESLIPEENYTAHRATLMDRMVALDKNSRPLMNWFSQFGRDSQPLVLSYSGEQNIMDLSAELEGLVQNLIQLHDARQKELEKQRAKSEKKAKKAVRYAQDLRKARQESILMLAEDGRETALAEEHIESESIEDSPDSIDGLWDMWDSIQTLYLSRLHEVFHHERSHRTEFFRQLKELQVHFIKYLYRPSEKMLLLSSFHKEFNQFTDENPDMREDDATISELHQRTEDLCNKLWDIIERREKEAEAELANITGSGWMEFESEKIAWLGSLLLQAECSRYFAAVQFLSDYYCCLDKKHILKIEFPQWDFILESISSVENLSKMCERVITAPVITPVEEEKEVKDPKAKGKPPAKGKAKQDEEVIPKSHNQIELEAALNLELQVLHAKVQRIKNWGTSKIKEIEAECKNIFDRMNIWIRCSTKAENEAVFQLSNVIRSAIESQTKIKPLLELNTLDIILHHDLVTYKDPVPPPLKAKESHIPHRLTIPQLESLLTELGQFPALIEKEILSSILIRRKKISGALKEYHGLSKMWQEKTDFEIIELVNGFDENMNGCVNWKDVMNSILLIDSLPVARDILHSYCIKLGEACNYETFIQQTAWFDDTEGNVDLPNSEKFDRITHIKSLLFNVNHEDGVIDGNELKATLKRARNLKEVFIQ